MSLAILSRENSTGISLTSSGSTRSGTSIRKMALSSHEENGQIPDSSEESTLEQSHKPARRYPATLSSTPLPPHRLAKIASSFGVHVPIPHSAPETTFGTRRSYSSSSYSRHHHRTTTATRLLLHVIPPETLPPSESRCLSGIRANARRGSLLPLHTTLKGQLEAIKREYNFPSIAGLVVYLLDIQDEDSTTTGFIGPKISEEAWKLLWYRALAMDRTDTKRAFLSPPPLPSTSPPSPMSAEDASETDSQSHEPATTDPFKSAAQRKLRSLHTAQGIRTSPSTTTLSSTNSNESHTFCLPHHPGMSQRSLSLNSDSSSITSARTLPSSTVVGKIEFDIDLDKGRWYEQWARRKSGGATSAPPTNRSLLSPAIVAQKEQERQQFRRGPLDVPTTPITPITPITLNDDVGDATYTQLADSNDGAGDDDGIGTADTTARAEDPETVLELRDEDVWRELHASDSLLTKSKANPHTQFNAMLEGTIPESDPIGVYSATRDLEEVLAKWNERRSTMGTTSATASPPPLDSPIVLRGEEVKSSSVIFPRPKPRSIPPPLPLDNDDKPSVEVSHASPTSTSPSFNLLEGAPFTNGVLSEEANENDSGSEYSNNSQVLFQQQLDRIEQHLAQVSPRKLPDGVTMPIAEAISPGPSPRELLEMVQNSPRSPLPGTPGFLSKGFSRPTPGQPLISTAASSPIVKRRPSGNTQWPAVPFEHVANEMRLNRTEPPVSPSFSSPSSTQRRSNATTVTIESSEEKRRTQLSVDEDSGPSRISGSSFTSINNRPATPAVLEPPPRTFSLPQPSSRFSAESSVSGEAEQEASTSTGGSRVSVKGFAKLFRNRSKSRDSGLRQSIDMPLPPVPVPSKVPPLPSIARTPSNAQPPTRPPRPAGHLRLDSGSDPFHFDQPSIRSAIAVSPSDPSNSGTTSGADRSSTSLKKRGILKGWGSSSKSSTAKTLANLTERAPAHSRNESTTSLSGRGLKATQRAESWISVSGDVAVISPPGMSSESLGGSSSGHTPALASVDDNHAASLVGVGAKRGRPTLNPLKPTVSSASAEASGGPRSSMEDAPTPRTSRFDIVAPTPRQEASRI